MNDYHIATKSLQEEKKAVHDYTQRISNAKNNKLKKSLTHALGEEKTHAKNFSAVKEALERKRRGK